MAEVKTVDIRHSYRVSGCQLSCPGQTRTKVAREFMRVEKQDLYVSFLIFHVLVKQEQELHES